jgi:hypothetical protein
VTIDVDTLVLESHDPKSPYAAEFLMP